MSAAHLTTGPCQAMYDRTLFSRLDGRRFQSRDQGEGFSLHVELDVNCNLNLESAQ